MKVRASARLQGKVILGYGYAREKVDENVGLHFSLRMIIKNVTDSEFPLQIRYI